MDALVKTTPNYTGPIAQKVGLNIQRNVAAHGIIGYAIVPIQEKLAIIPKL